MLQFKCIFKAITGYDCPFCGFQRSIEAITRGNLTEAFILNPFIYIVSPYIIMVMLCIVGVIKPQSKLYKALYSRTSIIVAMILTISWGVIRNSVSWG